MNQKQILAAVEAMLFACGDPIGADKLAQAVQLPQRPQPKTEIFILLLLLFIYYLYFL